MKKTLVVCLLQVTCIMFNSYGQNEMNPGIYLSNYTFSSTRNKVGAVCINPEYGHIEKIDIQGEDVDAVRVNNKYQLSIKKKYLKSKPRWLDITLNVQTSNGHYGHAVRLVNDQFFRNKVVAHRGAWKNAGTPENSIAALNHAVRLGCAGSEFDIFMSADSVLVVNHDPSIQGKEIEKTLADHLLTLKLTNGENLPTLEEYIKKGMSQNTTKLFLEIKPSSISKERGIATTRKVLELVRALKAQAWVYYISFDYEICKELIRLDPYVKVAYLNGDKTPEQLKRDKIWGYDYHISILKKNEAWIKAASALNLTSNTWTVNYKEDMQWLLNRKIDFITTNEPELLLEVLGE